MDDGRRSPEAIALEDRFPNLKITVDRKPRPTRRRQKIWRTKIYRGNQHTALQEAGKKEPQSPNGRVFGWFLLSSFRLPANNKQSTLLRYLCARMSEF